MAAKLRKGTVRIRIGPKRSRVKVGPWPFIFFLIACALVAAYAIAVNIDLEDKINAYYTFISVQPD